MKEVSKEEFLDFLKNYSKPLVQDFFMDWYSWNDFSDEKKWPESMVAMCQDDDYHGHHFKIAGDK